jgi:hypothetical protein
MHAICLELLEKHLKPVGGGGGEWNEAKRSLCSRAEHPFRLPWQQASNAVRCTTPSIPRPQGARALDVGSGSGYLAAAMALMVEPGGSVLGVEKVPELAVRSVESIARAAPQLLPPGAAAAEGRRRAPAGDGDGDGDGGPPLLEIVHGNVLSGGC